MRFENFQLGQHDAKSEEFKQNQPLQLRLEGKDKSLRDIWQHLYDASAEYSTEINKLLLQKSKFSLQKYNFFITKILIAITQQKSKLQNLLLLIEFQFKS